MINEDDAIRAIGKKIEELSEVVDYEKYLNWHERAISTLSNIYPREGMEISTFRNIRKKMEMMNFFEHSGYSNSDRTSSAKIKSEEYLNNLISNIENFGLPHPLEKNQKEPLNVNVHQHNEQNQSTEVNINFEFIIEVIKGELRDSEIEELKEILDADMEQKDKRKSFGDKIKSFGEGVASNILANILTNPRVYEQLGRML